MSDIEKLVAYNNVRSYLNTNQQKELLKNLNIDESNLKTRLRGLSIESEFYTILHLLKSCKHILSFDESTSVLCNSYSPDCLLVLADNSKIFVEIKSKEEFKYKISGGNLKKKIAFAKSFGIKLYFVIKFKFYWGLFSSDYLISKKGKLQIPDDYRNSEFENFFNSKTIIFPEGIKTKSYYSKNKDALLSIKHPEYGNLFKYEFFYNEDLIFTVEMKNKNDAIKSVVLELLHDAMNQQHKEIIPINQNDIVIIRKLLRNTMCWDYQFLFAHVTHVLTDLGLRYDTTSYYKNLVEEKGKSYFTIELLFTVLKQLIDSGVPVIVSLLQK
ncbi:hypothetical protein D4R71_07895 [bacterium]|nr:MAG: hypothetical protein D4R71_07895 [bacterium]